MPNDPDFIHYVCDQINDACFEIPAFMDGHYLGIRSARIFFN